MEQTELEKTETTGADEAPENKEEQPEEKIDGKALFNDVAEILETMLVSVFVILLLFGYVMRPVTVEGKSMFPTLHNQDRLVMYRLFYTPKVGDIVVVSDYEGHILDSDGNVVPSGYSLRENIIKRVIAVEGQSVNIDISAGAVYVDDVKLDEPYINELTLSNDGAFAYPITIPEGYIFVMGDNRNHSTDSRSSSVGLVCKKDVLGKAYFRYSAAEDDVTHEKGSIGFIQ